MLWRLKSLVLGFVLGLLFSPGSGVENRRRLWLWLQGKAEETAPRVQAQLQQAATKGATAASQTLDQARQQVAPMTHRAQEAAGAVRQNAQQQLGQATQQVSSKFGSIVGQARTVVPAAPAASQSGPTNAQDTPGNPVPTTWETPGSGLTAAEASPKNTLREVDRAEAEAEQRKQ